MTSFELIDDVRRSRPPIPPLMVAPSNLGEAINALRYRKRIDTKPLLNKLKLETIEVLLREIDHLDPLAQAFFLGVSETVLRKWRKLIQEEKIAARVKNSPVLDIPHGGR